MSDTLKQLDLVPLSTKHWDWENRLDGSINSLLTRREVMAICEAYAIPLLNASDRAEKSELQTIPEQIREVTVALFHS